MVLVILLVIIFFFGLKSYFKIDKQDVEAVEQVKPLTLNWLSYTEGLALAEKENKYVLIYFYTDKCSWCKKMIDLTYSNEEVKKILSDKFVTIKVNARSENKVVENEKEISERKLAESNHSRVAPLPGYVTTEQFIPVLNYIGEGWYKNISFKEYMEKI